MSSKKLPGNKLPHTVTPHLVDGGCDCSCPRCVSWLPRWSATDQCVQFSAACICPKCDQTCRGIGRLGDYDSVMREKGRPVPPPKPQPQTVRIVLVDVSRDPEKVIVTRTVTLTPGGPVYNSTFEGPPYVSGPTRPPYFQLRVESLKPEPFPTWVSTPWPVVVSKP